ncbi:hypothetical protein IH982_02585 [Patescibacteria group bacterium]|nr:hypothetical protein [Patescibacteria group bacterium]
MDEWIKKYGATQCPGSGNSEDENYACGGILMVTEPDRCFVCNKCSKKFYCNFNLELEELKS